MSPTPTAPAAASSALAPPGADRRAAIAATGAAAAAMGLATAVPFVAGLGPSERTKAMGAPAEVDLSGIPPGGLRTVEWRGKPVWVQRRTPEMIAALDGQDAQLADPASARDALPNALRNPGRSARPDVFVAIGVCTHLGCSPTAVDAGSGNPSIGDAWQGGFFCPCHGSTFDLAGRVFRNKRAPTNLEIPPHRFLSDTRLLIGESEEG
jgi:ubiquinol-cytochrome c reductase iron-sulfur subunit